MDRRHPGGIKEASEKPFKTRKFMSSTWTLSVILKPNSITSTTFCSAGKIPDTKFSVVLTSDDNAFNFARHTANPFFRARPSSFAG
jgi:hypothetical protein